MEESEIDLELIDDGIKIVEIFRGFIGRYESVLSGKKWEMLS